MVPTANISPCCNQINQGAIDSSHVTSNNHQEQNNPTLEFFPPNFVNSVILGKPNNYYVFLNTHQGRKTNWRIQNCHHTQCTRCGRKTQNTNFPTLTKSEIQLDQHVEIDERIGFHTSPEEIRCRSRRKSSKLAGKPNSLFFDSLSIVSGLRN